MRIARARWFEPPPEYLSGRIIRYPPWQKPPRGTLLNTEHELARGLVGFWSFNEGTGAKAFDSSGNGNHGVIAGALWQGGNRGHALSFDGLSDYVDLGESEWDGSWMNHTVLLWAAHNGTAINTEDTILSKGGGAPTGILYTLKHYGGGVTRQSVYMNNTDVSSDTGDITHDGNWHFLGISLDGSNVTFYLDGKADGTNAISDGGNNNFQLYIGMKSNDSSNVFNGLIGSMLIYNRALSAEEIALVYREPYAMFR